MNNVADHDIVTQVLDAIRGKRPIPDDVAVAANKYAVIDILRARIRKEDVPYLLGLARSSSTDVAKLALFLLRPFNDEPEVKSFVRSKWCDSTQYAERVALMWPLLDDRELDASIHEEVYQFVRENLPRFIEDCNEWFGGPGEVLNACIARLRAPTFPSTKDSVYLCSAIGSSERDSLILLLQEYQASKNEFTSRVAKDMADELANMMP